MNGDQLHERTAGNRELMRAIACRLATNAENIAATMVRAAEYHEMIGADPTHPMAPGSADHARLERAFAAKERREAERYRGFANRLT
jgi:hypothetical protein